MPPTRDPDRSSVAYQVSLQGEFGPAFLAAFAAWGVGAAATSSVLVLEAPDGMGLRDVAAVLEAHGLVILGIRRMVRREAPDSVPHPVRMMRRRRPGGQRGRSGAPVGGEPS